MSQSVSSVNAGSSAHSPQNQKQAASQPAEGSSFASALEKAQGEASVASPPLVQAAATSAVDVQASLQSDLISSMMMGGMGGMGGMGSMGSGGDVGGMLSMILMFLMMGFMGENGVKSSSPKDAVEMPSMEEMLASLSEAAEEAIISEEEAELIGQAIRTGGMYDPRTGLPYAYGKTSVKNTQSNRITSYYPLDSSKDYGDITNAAITRLGDPYSKPKAGQGDYTDCSYLSRWCYRQVGIEIPRTAAAQGKYCVDNGMTISKEELRPGDLIFFSLKENGRYMDITHVGIYAGNNMMVDASNVRGEVVYRPLFDGQVLYGRPKSVSQTIEV